MKSNQIIKMLYVFVRQSALFSLPALRRLRNNIYAMYFDCEDIAVDDFVRIGPAHSSNTTSIQIGKGLRVGRNVEIDVSGGVVLGDRVSISEDVRIYTHDHLIDGPSVNWRVHPMKMNRLVVGDDVWIGSGAVVLSGVSRIGRGAIIGAATVVISDVPDFAVVVGNPGRVVRLRKIGEDV